MDAVIERSAIPSPLRWLVCASAFFTYGALKMTLVARGRNHHSDGRRSFFRCFLWFTALA
jgi:hypothetical protein